MMKDEDLLKVVKELQEECERKGHTIKVWNPNGLGWEVMVRTHDLGGTNYMSICDIDRRQAQLLVDNGQATDMFDHLNYFKE